jgi:hypothetical protein
MKAEIREDSVNYAAQIIKLPALQPVTGLDNLVKVTIQGNDCLIGKDTNVDEPHVFFPAECQISAEFLKTNNLYRHSENNFDPAVKGFFEDNGRVKTLKFKGVISSGFVIPVRSLGYIKGYEQLKIGQEFTSIDGYEICKKYYRKPLGVQQAKQPKLLDKLVDSRLAPEHFDTSHLLRNTEKLSLEDYVAVTYKLHGTSARYFNTLTKRKLSWTEKLLRWLGYRIETEEYNYVCASRKVIKSVAFETLKGKNHFYDEDLWTAVGDKLFKDRLNKGEAVYCEIIGKDYTGKAIQHGYTYGISNISPQGIETDLPYQQMKERSMQLGIPYCPELFYGTLRKFLGLNENFKFDDDRDFSAMLEGKFYKVLLEKPSILDPTVVEEGFCIRVDRYPRPEIFKIKSKKFLLHEGALLDQDIPDMEADQV